ncbi:hypothetical protein LTR66_017744, partial [Elasticomyces elasticus]
MLRDLQLAPELQASIVTFLCSIVSSMLPIDVKVYTMTAISDMLKVFAASLILPELLVQSISSGLDDYTNDQRGDIGSLLRSESISAASRWLSIERSEDSSQAIVQRLVRLAMEKLIKVRYQAWSCLQDCWTVVFSDIPLESRYQHQVDVSSFEYYSQLIHLLSIKWLRNSIIHGLTSSTAGGNEDVGHAAGDALMLYTYELDEVLQPSTIESFVQILLADLDKSVAKDDREVVPILDMLCFLLEQVDSDLLGPVIGTYQSQISSTIDKLHSPIADIARIQ